MSLGAVQECKHVLESCAKKLEPHFAQDYLVDGGRRQTFFKVSQKRV